MWGSKSIIWSKDLDNFTQKLVLNQSYMHVVIIDDSFFKYNAINGYDIARCVFFTFSNTVNEFFLKMSCFGMN